MRDTWAAYLVDIATGKIEWTLGGKSSSFKLGPGADFEWQHDVRLQPDSTVSLYDDHCCQLTGGGTYVNPTAPSRGLVLKLDQQSHTATLAAQYGRDGDFDLGLHGRHPAAVKRQRVRRLGLGTVLLRVQPLRASCSSKPNSRVRTSPTARRSSSGSACPSPRRSARHARWAGATVVYASWNGATKVASWRVLAGAGVSHLTAVASAPRVRLRDGDRRAPEATGA